MSKQKINEQIYGVNGVPKALEQTEELETALVVGLSAAVLTARLQTLFVELKFHWRGAELVMMYIRTVISKLIQFERLKERNRLYMYA